MRWKVFCLVLLGVVFLQCGEDTPMTNGNADPKAQPATVEIYEFKTPEELAAFRFPSDIKGTLGFRVTRIDRQLEPFTATPVRLPDGQQSFNTNFIDTEVVRIIVFR